MPEDKPTTALVATRTNGPVSAVPEYYTLHPSSGYPEAESDEKEVHLSHYLWILRRHKWKLLSFVAFCVASTLIVSARLTPIYEATASLDIDRQAPAAIIGQDAARLPSADADQFLATQIKTIQSDSVIRPVVERFNLAGHEEASIDNKLLSTRVQNAPVKLSSLKVTRPPNTYLLLVSYRSPDPELAANVANGIAQSYILHTYNIRFTAAAGLSTYMEKQLDELKAKMEQSSARLAQFERDLSVINPEEKTSILSSRLLQLNTEFTTAQGDRVRKQAAFDSVKNGSLEAAEASTQGDQLRRLADRLDEVRERFAVIKTQYGGGHPEYKKAASQVGELELQFSSLKNNITGRVGLEFQEATNRENMLKQAVADVKAEFDRINAHSFEYKAVKQEADADKGLYEELVRKIKEAGINSSFQNSSIRLSDPARPPLRPVFPDQRMNGILAFLFSSLLGVGAAVLADVMDNSIRDPEQVQRELKTDVLGSLPIVTSWRNKQPIVATNGNKTRALVDSGRQSGQVSSFEEAIRMLRDSVLLSDLRHRPRSLLITSTTPREGKTTTSAHLGIAHSLQGRKTLLIDADLRRPGLHERFGLTNLLGLSNVASGDIDWRDALQKPKDYPDLDVLTAGRASRRAADRLGTVLDKVLAEAEKTYDLVVVDSPPVLGFAEPLQIATIVDGVVVVALAGQTNRNAVGSVLTNLKRVKANVIGVALNEVRQDISDHYYYYGYSGKYYSKYYKPVKA
jgi:succinoglycan biosynthesis transport protein ExoP